MDDKALDLSPARWIWLPSQRTLPNTFVVFRREVTVDSAIRCATGHILADSRYRLWVNGQRVQWGPSPADPRWPEADPVDLTGLLEPGKNVLGVEVVHFGHPDGTWVAGKPGLLFKLEIETDSGERQTIVSDARWHVLLDRSHRPGEHARWFLRSLQETFDARSYPWNFTSTSFDADDSWLAACELGGRADEPATRTDYRDFMHDSNAVGDDCAILRRSIAMLDEQVIDVTGPVWTSKITWHRDPDDWFEMRVPGSFTVGADADVKREGTALTVLPAGKSNEGTLLTFAFERQMVGFPIVDLDAPAGTIVEIIAQESHDPTVPTLLDSHYFTWSRLICREGVNRFEAFDFESLRWLQLHVRNASHPVTVRRVALRRRVHPWTNPARAHCSEASLDRLFQATLNTLDNSAQETCVDGMGRERQQYSGDCGHQLDTVRYARGQFDLTARFIRTYSRGMTPAGYFLDCWPAPDRLIRIAQRHIEMNHWGPILDHGVQFGFDCWRHYLYTGDLDTVGEAWPRLVKFAEYLIDARNDDGLLAVEGLGIPVVWLDFTAFGHQRHKQCAFNLYVAGMFAHALAPLGDAFGEADRAERFRRVAGEIHAATVERYWSADHGTFVDNLPWLDEERAAARYSDRTLAMAVQYDQLPTADVAATMKILADCPPELGRSYPANAGWRYHALGRLGRADVIVTELRRQWATMTSVETNRTIQEFFTVRPDSIDQFSHCSMVPLNTLFMDIAGIVPTAPGFSRCRIRPQLADLPDLAVTVWTPLGPITFDAHADGEGHRIEIVTPEHCHAELVLPEGSDSPADEIDADTNDPVHCWCPASPCRNDENPE